MRFSIGTIVLIVGVIVIIMGLLIWKKQMISLVSMHANVKESDKEAFCKMTGQSTIGFGVSIMCLGLFFAKGMMALGFVLFAICFVMSFILYLIAQNKYNR